MEGAEGMGTSGAGRARITAAAQAIWRVSEPAWFDASLRDEMRRSAASAIGAVGALSVGAPFPVERDVDAALAAIAATEELVRFARDLALVSNENAERVLGCYRVAREEIAAFQASTRIPPAGGDAQRSAGIADDVADALELNRRQERIIAYVRENGQAGVSDLAGFFGEKVSEKTLQRDLTYLADSGILLRRGGNRWTTYCFNSKDVPDDATEISQ